MPDRIAVLADTHGNRWALEAVLEDVERRAPDLVVDLGDTVYGPLDPGGTAEILLARRFPTVRGNQDRLVIEPPPEVVASATFRHVRGALGDEALAWLAGLPSTLVIAEEVLLCHGTPERDDAYLLEEVDLEGARVRTPEEISGVLGGVPQRVILCGHGHVPRLLAAADGRLVVNPGSVGLPAYEDELPYRHAMEAGSPHARYALLERRERGWTVEHVAVPYDWQTAAACAEKLGRVDWASCLRTGRVV